MPLKRISTIHNVQWCTRVQRGDLAKELAFIHELPRRGLLRNGVSGVRNSRKLNPCYYSSLKTLYVGGIRCVADRGYARIHEQLSSVGSSRKLGFRLEAFSETR